MPTAPCFYVKKDDHKGIQINLDHFPFIVGRARECDYVVDSNQISRLHAQFDFDYQQVLLRDLGSTNGTYINGERLVPNKDYRLRASDEIQIANVATLIFDDPATTNQLSVSELMPVGLRLDEASAQVYVLDKLLDPPLSPSQFVLMTLLVENEDVVVTRDEIRDFVWGKHEEVNDQTIDALVSRLRKRLQEADPAHEYIITRRGFGLMFRNRRGAGVGN